MPRTGLDTAALLQATAELADRNGLESVTLASLAQRLDIRSPSLYNHVKGLSDLRLKLAVHALDKLHDVLLRSAVGLSGDEAVRALGQAYVGFVRSHPGLYEATQLAADMKNPEMQRVGKFKIVDLVVRVLAYYDLEGEASLHAVRVLRSLLHGFASLEQHGGFGLPLDLDRTLELLIDTFLAGIGTMRQTDRQLCQ
jgi:AcrR family transcriptional regulator